MQRLRSALRLNLRLGKNFLIALLIVIVLFELYLYALSGMIKSTDTFDYYAIKRLNRSRSRPASSRPRPSSSYTIDSTHLPFDRVVSELMPLKLRPGGQRLALSNQQQQQKQQQLAIIVPYRNRHRNLRLFIRHIHKFLAKQDQHYTIYLIEPLSYLKFNRGLLMNIGFIESIRDSNEIDCFIFHDVDMIPENLANIYHCDPKMPIHYAVSLSNLDYK